MPPRASDELEKFRRKRREISTKLRDQERNKLINAKRSLDVKIDMSGNIPQAFDMDEEDERTKRQMLEIYNRCEDYGGFQESATEENLDILIDIVANSNIDEIVFYALTLIMIFIHEEYNISEMETRRNLCNRAFERNIIPLAFAHLDDSNFALKCRVLDFLHLLCQIKDDYVLDLATCKRYLTDLQIDEMTKYASNAYSLMNRDVFLKEDCVSNIWAVAVRVQQYEVPFKLFLFLARHELVDFESSIISIGLNFLLTSRTKTDEETRAAQDVVEYCIFSLHEKGDYATLDAFWYHIHLFYNESCTSSDLITANAFSVLTFLNAYVQTCDPKSHQNYVVAMARFDEIDEFIVHSIPSDLDDERARGILRTAGNVMCEISMANDSLKDSHYAGFWKMVENGMKNTDLITSSECADAIYMFYNSLFAFNDDGSFFAFPIAFENRIWRGLFWSALQAKKFIPEIIFKHLFLAFFDTVDSTEEYVYELSQFGDVVEECSDASLLSEEYYGNMAQSILVVVNECIDYATKGDYERNDDELDDVYSRYDEEFSV